MSESTFTPATSRETALRARLQRMAELRITLSERRHGVSLRKSTEMEAYANLKSRYDSREFSAWIVLFDRTRAGRKICREFASFTKKIDAITAAMRQIETLIDARAEVIAAKAAEKSRLAEFNESIKSRRVYSFSQRRRSSWGRVQTFHSIDAHGIKKLPDGRFVVDKHTLSYDVVYIYRPEEARSRVEGRGDVFATGPGAELSRDEIIKILSKPRTEPTNGTAADWKQRHDKQRELRESFEIYSKILERRTDPRNKYARWLVSLGACNSGICAAMKKDPCTPYDTIRNGDPGEISYLRNHAIHKITGAVPKLFELTEELCTFPSWETFE